MSKAKVGKAKVESWGVNTHQAVEQAIDASKNHAGTWQSQVNAMKRLAGFAALFVFCFMQGTLLAAPKPRPHGHRTGEVRIEGKTLEKAFKLVLKIKKHNFSFSPGHAVGPAPEIPPVSAPPNN